MTTAELYAHAYRQHGTCPIEAGVLGRLADHECQHGRLPGDRTPPCGCWPNEPDPAPVALFPVPDPILVVPTREVLAA